MDTVEVAKDWQTDPFIIHEEGDKLIGLGVNDMKGGLAAILSAIQGFTPKGFKLKVVFGADEEKLTFFAVGFRFEPGCRLLIILIKVWI